MSFEEFQDSHIWCQNGTNLAVLNLHVSPMPPTKFQLNPNYPLGADVISRFSWWPAWKSWNDICSWRFWISMSLWYLPLSLGSIYISVWEAMSFEEFQDSHTWCRNGTNLAVLNLHVFPMPPTGFQLNMNYPSGADVLSRFSSWPPWQPS